MTDARNADLIQLTGLRFHGHHGVFDHERADGQPFIIDLELRTDHRAAAASDDLDDTIDYGQVADRVAAIVTGDPRNLIEALAQDIADAVLEDERIASIRVTVHKPDAPIMHPFDDVAVVIERSR